MRTPAPKAIMEATQRCGILKKYPKKAPRRSAEPATNPHIPAIIMPDNIEPQ
jgi:hypothetical protein